MDKDKNQKNGDHLISQQLGAGDAASRLSVFLSQWPGAPDQGRLGISTHCL